MLQAGLYHHLTVSRISNHGLYLADEEGDEVLLPNRYVSLADKVGDVLRVFVYHDSEDRLVASTERPLAVVGEAEWMQVVDTNDHGAFLNWGLSSKDLFVPHRKQTVPMTEGQRHIVFVYRDELTGRAVASARLKDFIQNDELTVEPGQEVGILLSGESEIGFRVIVENRHWGMLYRNQLFRPAAVGDRMKAFVRKITDDNRIDVSLQQEGFDEVRKAAGRILELIEAAGGVLPVGDDSPPEEVRAAAGMSKKVFKRALGNLLKQGFVSAEPYAVRMTDPAAPPMEKASPAPSGTGSARMSGRPAVKSPDNTGAGRFAKKPSSRPAPEASGKPAPPRPEKKTFAKGNRNGSGRGGVKSRPSSPEAEKTRRPAAPAPRKPRKQK